MEAINRLISATRANRLNICVIGDVMADLYIHGRFADAPQEDCPKFVETVSVKLPGGAANAARQLANWNAETWLIGITGYPGMTNVWPVNVEYNPELCFRIGQVPVKARHIVNDKHVWRHDNEVAEYGLNSIDIVECRQLALQAIEQKKFAAVLIADYDKGFMDRDMVRRIIGICNERKIPVVVDAKRESDIYNGAVIQCNSAYMRKYGNWSDASNSPNFIITNGNHSPIVGRKPLPWKPTVPCVNHVGAGDCFAAHMTLALAHGLPLEDAATIANSAGRMYVQHRHGRATFPHEIARDACGDKVVTDLAALRKSVDGKLVLADGPYQGVTASFSRFVKTAKSQGDCLVVGLNKRMSLTDSIEIMSSMDAVDWIVVFESEKQISELKPDILGNQ